MTEKNYTVEQYIIPKMLGVKELSKEFNIPVTAIRQWINCGQLPVVVCGKKYLVNCTVFSKFLEGTPIAEPHNVPPVAVGNNGELYAENKTNNRVARISPIY